MIRRLTTALLPVISAAVFVAACTADPTAGSDDAPEVPVPGRGLVSQEREPVKAYAACLRKEKADVTEVIGVYVVANQGAGGSLDKADSKCESESSALYKSLEDDRRVADEDGNRFWYFVRGCMENGLASYRRVDHDLLVVADRDTQYTKDFRQCVAIARTWPGETPSPSAPPWPDYPSKSAKSPADE